MKRFLIWTAILLTGCANIVLSQTYPTRPIRLIVPAAAGGGTDIVARLIGQKLTERFGHTVVVDDRVGGNGIVGTEAFVKASPDGYTLGMAQPGPITIGRTLYPSLPYNPERDLVPIILANESSNVLAVHPSIPAHTVKELVALAKVRSLNAALGNIGAVQHLLTEMLNRAAGIKMNNIPYKGGGLAATDVVGGQVDLLWSVLPVVLPFIQNGRLRALAMASEKRSPFLPNVPTTGESGWPSVVGTAWNGVVAPVGTPKNIIDLLNAEIGRGLNAPDVRARFTTLGMEPFSATTPQQFGAFLKVDTIKWGEVIKAAKIKAE